MRRGPHLGAGQATGWGADTKGLSVTTLQEKPDDSSARSTVGHETKSMVHIQFKTNDGNKRSNLTRPHLC